LTTPDDVLVRAQMRRLETLVARLHASMASTERECMGLHAALVEAIRRLSAQHIKTDDLRLALDNPGSAPLNWRGGDPAPRKFRTQAENAAEYDRIFGEDAH